MTGSAPFYRISPYYTSALRRRLLADRLQSPLRPEPPTGLEVSRYALRTFRIDYDRLELRSIAVEGPTLWPQGVCIAECLKHDRRFANYSRSKPFTTGHAAPDLTCECGVYGSLSYENLLDQYPESVHAILAVIEVEGITVIASRGLRTQAARVVGYSTGDSDVKHICQRQLREAEFFPDYLSLITHYRLAIEADASARQSTHRGMDFWLEDKPAQRLFKIAQRKT